ncbi:pyridoxal-dependent decarboxylase [Undibacterium arcticum]
MIPLAHRYGAWVHVDGAFGLWANVSARHRHLLAGVEHADSWATDGHKWLNVPYDSGFAFVAHPQAHRNAMSYEASYISHNDQVREQKGLESGLVAARPRCRRVCRATTTRPPRCRGPDRRLLRRRA